MSKKIDIRKIGKRSRNPSKSLDRAIKHFTTHKHGDFLSIKTTQLTPDPNQPRKNFDDSKIEELTVSIKDKGVLQPLLVRFDDDKFWIVAGERRYRASILADLKSVPCLVTTGDPEEISLIENIQREDLTPIELANAIDRMMKKHNYNQTQIAKIIGKTPNTISGILAVKKLPEEIQKDISRARERVIPRRTLIEIAKEPPEKAQKLYDAAKKGATSDEIRQKRTQTTTKNSAEEILSRKIQVVIKALDGLENQKRLKLPTVKELRELRDKLISFLS